MSIRVVTVFGGTGFLGRRVVRHLRKHEFSVRIASRHPDRSRKLFGSDDPCLRSAEVDTRDERSRLLRRLPIYPMFGHGRTRLQPAYVENVAEFSEATARLLGPCGNAPLPIPAHQTGRADFPHQRNTT
jgi:NAD(P)-dependent dehydrogenase (short-subunit alcohol dehydrogenase family)